MAANDPVLSFPCLSSISSLQQMNLTVWRSDRSRMGYLTARSTARTAYFTSKRLPSTSRKRTIPALGSHSTLSSTKRPMSWTRTKSTAQVITKNIYFKTRWKRIKEKNIDSDRKLPEAMSFLAPNQCVDANKMDCQINEINFYFSSLCLSFSLPFLPFLCRVSSVWQGMWAAAEWQMRWLHGWMESSTEQMKTTPGWKRKSSLLTLPGTRSITMSRVSKAPRIRVPSPWALGRRGTSTLIRPTLAENSSSKKRRRQETSAKSGTLRPIWAALLAPCSFKRIRCYGSISSRQKRGMRTIRGRKSHRWSLSTSRPSTLYTWRPDSTASSLIVWRDLKFSASRSTTTRLANRTMSARRINSACPTLTCPTSSIFTRRATMKIFVSPTSLPIGIVSLFFLSCIVLLMFRELSTARHFLVVHLLTVLLFFFLSIFSDFTGGTLGLAWVASPSGASGGICERYKTYTENMAGYPRTTKRSLNTGIITFVNYNSRVPPKVSQLTLAHEIGHNFGSPHDYPSQCRPGGQNGKTLFQIKKQTNYIAEKLETTREIKRIILLLLHSLHNGLWIWLGNYIMFASATSGERPNNSKFSNCSVGNISSVLDAIEEGKKKNCFTGNLLNCLHCSCQAKKNPLTSHFCRMIFLLDWKGAFCGNKIVEDGEECDCGYDDDECEEKCCYPRVVSESDRALNPAAQGCKRRPSKMNAEIFLFLMVCWCVHLFIHAFRDAVQPERRPMLRPKLQLCAIDVVSAVQGRGRMQRQSILQRHHGQVSSAAQ